jgi:enamine deaminase RidA (YjgF/YER057c/UK114 family)
MRGGGAAVETDQPTGADSMTIERKHSNERMSQIVIHGDTVYLAGQVAVDAAGELAGAQMKNILDRIDGFLGEAGSDKSKILSATIWLADMRDFDAINQAWDAWVAPGNAPARACVEAKLAFTKFTVEVGIIAAR